MKVSASLPTGVAALFFDSARRRRRLEERLVERLGQGGFTEVVLPVLDYLDPYEEMPGRTKAAELYRFVDRDGEVLALRSDFTPMLARLLAPRLKALELPLKLFYRGDVLRCQEERPGRQRELYQLGAEIIGDDGEEAERTVLRQCLELLSTCVSRRRMLVVLGFAGALDQLLDAQVDAAALTAAVVRRERSATRPGGETLREVVLRGTPSDPAALGEEAGARLERLTSLTRELGPAFPEIELKIDLAEFADQVLATKLRRKLHTRPYYDGLVFRAFASGSAEPVGGGGRYDRLFRRLDVETTAAGFSLSLDRLSEAGENGGEVP